MNDVGSVLGRSERPGLGVDLKEDVVAKYWAC